MAWGAIVDKIKAGTSENGLVPATDSSARVVLDADEQGRTTTLSFSNLQSWNKTKGKAGQWFNNFNVKSMDGHVYDADWQITFTPRRLIIWSPKTVGMFGSLKVKPGVATGGQILYQWIDEVMREGALRLALPFDMKPDRYTTHKMLTLGFESAAEAAGITTALVDYLTAFYQENESNTPDLIETLSQIRAINWTSLERPIFSLMKAGAKVKYMP